MAERLRNASAHGISISLVSSTCSSWKEQGGNAREIVATFLIGTVKETTLEITFKNVTSISGDEAVLIRAPPLFVYSDGDSSPESFNATEIKRILEGVECFHAYPSPSAGTATRQRLQMAELLEEAIELVVEAHGYEDEHGVGLGVQGDDVFGAGWLDVRV